MSAAVTQRPNGFQHEVLLYEGTHKLAPGLLPFIEEGLDQGEAVLVVVTSDKIALLREALGRAAGRVRFAPMEELGRNPARIIPAWKEFLDDHLAAGNGVRGVGEPIFRGRSDAELDECHRHEALLNRAFDGSGDWRLLCPYDVTSLDPSVIKQAHWNHPIVSDGRAQASCVDYRHGLSPFEGELPTPPADHAVLPFETGPLRDLRAMVSAQSAHAGLDADRTADLLLAVNELATNSLRHGGGQGTLRVWREPSALVCELDDRGRIVDPLVGRERPAAERSGGRGVWLANQLCDLVQIRSSERGTTVRVHMGTT